MGLGRRDRRPRAHARRLSARWPLELPHAGRQRAHHGNAHAARAGDADAPPGADRTRALSASAWTSVAERGSLWGLRVTAWVYRHGGRRFAAALVAVVVAYFFVTDRRGR